MASRHRAPFRGSSIRDPTGLVSAKIWCAPHASVCSVKFHIFGILSAPHGRFHSFRSVAPCPTCTPLECRHLTPRAPRIAGSRRENRSFRLVFFALAASQSRRPKSDTGVWRMNHRGEPVPRKETYGMCGIARPPRRRLLTTIGCLIASRRRWVIFVYPTADRDPQCAICFQSVPGDGFTPRHSWPPSHFSHGTEGRSSKMLPREVAREGA